MKNIKWHYLVSWPVIFMAVLAGFSVCMFYVLPYVNGVGMTMFYADNDTFIMYFFVPFTAVDTVILLGYCKAVRYLAPRLDRKIAAVCGRVWGIIFRRKKGV